MLQTSWKTRLREKRCLTPEVNCNAAETTSQLAGAETQRSGINIEQRVAVARDMSHGADRSDVGVWSHKGMDFSKATSKSGGLEQGRY